MSATTVKPSAPVMPDNEASFGLGCTRLVIRPKAGVENDKNDSLRLEAGILLNNALAVFDAVTEQEDVSHLFWAGLYSLRQAVAVLNVAQGCPAEGGAA